MSKKIKVIPHPEVVVASREDSDTAEKWTVKAGSSNRGDAFTDLSLIHI